MKIPYNLKNFFDAAKVLAEKNIKSEMLFSEGTYEVEIKEDKDVYWPFLQITDEGNIRDVFCLCEELEEKGMCRHIAAGYIRIFNSNDKPLHVRFRDSFWKALFEIISKKFFYNINILKVEDKNDFSIFGQNDGFFLRMEVLDVSLVQKFL